MLKTNVTFQIMVKNRPVTEYFHNGKNYIEGRKGSEYTLKITNHSYSKILVVPTIDGLSVMDGKPANYKSSGYIINGFGTLEVDGWRTDLNSVRKFEFSSRSGSYSNKAGEGTDNLGVIGLAVFNEKIDFSQYLNWNSLDAQPQDLYWHSYNSPLLGVATSSLAATPDTTIHSKGLRSINAVSETIAKSSLGTAMGEKKTSKVVEAKFERADSPFQVFEVYYYERKQLEKMGIISKVVPNAPRAFPSQFCKEV